MDITNVDAMAQLCRSIHDRWGLIDVWVHTAIHAAPPAPAAHIDAKDWDKSVAANVTAMGQLIPMVEPLLQAAQNGVAIIPDDPRGGEKFFDSYGATKAAQITLVRSWQLEAAKIGPRVCIPTPAPMPTAVRARFYPGEDRGALADPLVQARRILAEIFASGH
jgi:NAD(P)-dependent dehydrogenase (short-subunit alcohol dehydrogenase family)